jgi:hypothetical protein
VRSSAVASAASAPLVIVELAARRRQYGVTQDEPALPAGVEVDGPLCEPRPSVGMPTRDLATALRLKPEVGWVIMASYTTRFPLWGRVFSLWTALTPTSQRAESNYPPGPVAGKRLCLFCGAVATSVRPHHLQRGPSTHPRVGFLTG